MPAVAGDLVRPLLPVGREALRDYLRRTRLGWQEDPSNTDVRFDRNYLRTKVIPLIEARWPAAAVTVGRSASLAAEAQQLLESQADQALRHARDGAALRASALRRLKPAERRNALRRWLALQELPLPDQRRLQELCGPLLRARHDAQPQVAWPGALVRRHGDLLHGFPEAERASQDAGGPGAPAPTLWDWRRQPRLALPGGAALCLRRDPRGPLSIAALPRRFELRFRRGGERLAASHGGQTLKRLLQERRLPPWQRDAVPLLYDAQGRLVAVADWWCDPALRHRGPGSAPADAPDGRLRPTVAKRANSGQRARLVWIAAATD